LFNSANNFSDKKWEKMYFNRAKHLYSNWFETFSISKDKSVSSVALELGQFIKLMLFKKIEMFIIAFDLSSKIRFPDLKCGLTIYPITTHEQIASLNEVVGLSNYKPYDTINWLHKIFNNGSIGFIAFKNDHPVGCCWASEKTPSSLFPGVRIPLERGNICVHTLFVSQINRRQKVGKALAIYRLRFLQNKGYKRALATVEKDNIAALKTDKKIGYVTIGEVSGVRVLFWSRTRFLKYLNESRGQSLNSE
jgi:GNAT superfamily N-acetyltransferase